MWGGNFKMARRIKKASEAKGPRLIEAPEELTTIAARLVDEGHSGLSEAKITYWMIAGNWRKKGEVVDADCTLVTGVNRKESGNVIFRIFVNESAWNNADEKLRSYILDNQLTRCCKGETGNGEARWYVQDYSVKAFPSIIAKYGIITDEMKKLDTAMRQTSLFEPEVEPPAKTNVAEIITHKVEKLAS